MIHFYSKTLAVKNGGLREKGWRLYGFIYERKVKLM